MRLTDLAVSAADFLRHREWLGWLARSPLFRLLKEDVLRTLLIDPGGFPVDAGIRPILRRRQSRRVAKIIPSRPRAGAAAGLLLIQPPLPSNLRHKVIVPVGIAYIAGHLRRHLPQVCVGILDGLVHDLDLEAMVALASDPAWDIVGISAITCQADFAYRLADRLRVVNPRQRIVMGGVHPTLLPDEALAHADAVVIGEGEETVREMLAATLAGREWEGIPGTWVRGLAGTVAAAARPLIADLDTLAFPAYDLLPIHLYNNPLHVVGGERLPLFASRGCPFACAFCNSPQVWRRRVRFRRPAEVLREVDWIVETFGIRKFHFWDDNLFLRPAQMREILEGFVARGGFAWVGLDRAESVIRHADLLPLAKRSGCVGIEIGVESVNPDTFEFIQKGQGGDDAREAVRLQKAAGLAPLCTYMALNPGETISGYRLQKQFLDQLQEGLPWYQFFHQLSFPVYLGQFATPHPGTGFAAQAAHLGEDLATSHAERFHHGINFVPRSLLDDVPVVVPRSGRGALDGEGAAGRSGGRGRARAAATAGLERPDDPGPEGASQLPRRAGRFDRQAENLLYAVALTALWDWFDGTTPLRAAAAKLRRFAQVAGAFLDAIDGKRPVTVLADEAAARAGVDRKTALQVVALTCYIYGQLGLLASAAPPAAGDSDGMVGQRAAGLVGTVDPMGTRSAVGAAGAVGTGMAGGPAAAGRVAEAAGTPGGMVPPASPAERQLNARPAELPRLPWFHRHLVARLRKAGNF